ncbi:globin domain-containing protein [Bacteriovoracaceae bacterium]|nr:globin domain-containing protein [Bacteriovoracaceae bacterium]
MGLNIKVIRESFAKAVPIADKVVTKFYQNLFADYPQSTVLFENVDMKKQKKALIGSLVYIVDHVDQADDLIPFLKGMGQRHVSYGTQEEHYEWVGKSLLKTFAEFLGDGWTKEVESEWINAFDIISTAMLEGAKAALPEPESIRQKAEEVCTKLLKNVIDDRMDDEFIKLARGKVRHLLLELLEDESKLLLDQKKAA